MSHMSVLDWAAVAVVGLAALAVSPLGAAVFLWLHTRQDSASQSKAKLFVIPKKEGE